MHCREVKLSMLRKHFFSIRLGDLSLQTSPLVYKRSREEAGTCCHSYRNAMARCNKNSESASLKPHSQLLQVLTHRVWDSRPQLVC